LSYQSSHNHLKNPDLVHFNHNHHHLHQENPKNPDLLYFNHNHPDLQLDHPDLLQHCPFGMSFWASSRE
jgi:hypothetical protein